MQKLQKDLEKIGFKIKHHEDNLKILQKQINNIDVSILDMQGAFSSSLLFENLSFHVLYFSFLSTKSLIIQYYVSSFLCLLTPLNAAWTVNYASLDVVGTYATVSLGKYHASNGKDHANNNSSNKLSEHEITNQILLQEKTAAGLFCKLKTHHASQASQMPLTKDVLGIVALLGKVPDVNLSRCCLCNFYQACNLSVVIIC